MKFEVRSSKREQMIDVTEAIAQSVLGVAAGAVLVFCTHTTAGLTINENADPDVEADLLAGLSKLAPFSAGYRHAEGNSDAHIKASLTGSSLVVPIEEGELALGRWQGIYLCEFDGPRPRTLHVTVLDALE